MSIRSRLKYKLLPRRIKSKWSYADFLYYRMQEIGKADIDDFMTVQELEAFEKSVNSDKFRDVFNSKELFYKRFAAYIHREYVLIRETSSNELEAFIKKHGRVIIKPDDMYAGKGISYAYINDKKEVIYASACPDYDTLKRDKYIAEEWLFNEKSYADIYNKSLNTVRITTFIKGDSADIIFAVNQFGSSGDIVDNDEEKGIWAAVDIGTGNVYATEINASNGYVNDRHPDTGKDILGFVNKSWDQMKKLSLKLAMEVPECRLVGWDIAVLEDGSIELIEGNVTPELDLYQAITKKGLAKLLQK